MRNKLIILVAAGLLLSLVCSFQSVEAQKSSKKGAISDADITAMATTLNNLTQKMYGNGLFSPDDNEKLISIKLKLDDQMLVSPDPTLAPLYYKIAVLFKSREMKDEAIDSFQTILENFADTALAPKAADQLKAMGVAVKAPTKQGGDSGE